MICEGPTEANFVQTCLMPHLAGHAVLAYPSVISARSGNHRGGRVTVERLAKHLACEYHQTDRITTLVDYYGFRDADGRSRAQLESDILADANKWGLGKLDPRFVLPYVQMYEFEGLLFTDVEQFQNVLDGWGDDVRIKLQAVRHAFASPEDINNDRETAPSKRILRIFANGEYSKTEHGPLIAEAIGLAKIRASCPQFDGWLKRLEAWGRE